MAYQGEVTFEEGEPEADRFKVMNIDIYGTWDSWRGTIGGERSFLYTRGLAMSST